MAEEHEHDHHDHHEGHDHDHHGHDDHDHDHTLIVDRLPEGNWTIDPEQSDVAFSTRALLGIVPVSGYFDRFSGELQVSADGTTSGSLTVEVDSLDTGIDKRDTHLRTADFFHAEQHPQFSFMVESLTASGQEHLDLQGSLKIRETTIPLAFPVYAVAHGDHLHLEARVAINHKQAGLGWAKPGMVAGKVRAQLGLTLVRA